MMQVRNLGLMVELVRVERMGKFTVNIQVGDEQGQTFEEAEALVDSGATFGRLRRGKHGAVGRPDYGRYALGY